MEESAESVIQKCSVNEDFWKKLCEILRKIPVLKSLFNGVSGFETCNFNRLLLSFAKFFLKRKIGLKLVPRTQFQHEF